jgi:hypothetical protein
MDRMGAPDVGDAGLREAEKSDFSLLDQIAHRAGHILDRHRPVHAMLIEQIDVVGAKPPQRALDRFPDMRGPAVSADDAVAIETPAEPTSTMPGTPCSSDGAAERPALRRSRYSTPVSSKGSNSTTPSARPSAQQLPGHARDARGYPAGRVGSPGLVSCWA